MMSGPLAIEILLAAFGIAINPPAVIAAILLLASSRRKAIAFAGGWIVGLLVIGCVLMFIGDAIERPGHESVPMLVLKVVVGIALLGFAVSKWRGHRKASGDKELPGWMDRLYHISAPRAFFAAAAYAALNPKTIAFSAAGVLAIMAATLNTRIEWAALFVFVLLASISVTMPVLAGVVFPRRSERALALAERWLGDNSSLVAAGVLLVLGIMVLYTGVDGLVHIYSPV
jgi:threonine/homoserine/homoserine lactone efflux protein